MSKGKNSPTGSALRDGVGLGVGLGVAFGAAFGAAFGDVALGVAFGAAFGPALGATYGHLFDAPRRNRAAGGSDPEEPRQSP